MEVAYWCQLGAATVLSGFLIAYYSDVKAACYAKVLVFVGVLCSLLCFALLPLDIYSSSLPDSPHLGALQQAWLGIYYANFFLCWLVLPFAQEYEDSGEFAPKGRVRESLVINGILIGVICVGAIAIVVYLVATGSFTAAQLPSVLATLVNAFGLTLVSILLGYGLISFPKECFLRKDHRKLVTHCHRQAQAIKTDQETIAEEVAAIRKVLERVGDNREPSQKQIVLTLIQENFELGRVLAEDEAVQKLARKSTADLHKAVKKRILQKGALESQLDELVDELRTTSVAFQSNGYRYRRAYYSFLFLLTSVLALLIFFAQLATFARFLSPANLLAMAVGAAGESGLLLNACLAGYVGWLVTHTIFRVKVYKVFALHRGHSSASSLLFTAINLARVSYPLCYNYLQITGLPRAAFLDFFGEVTLSAEVMVVFPILMLAFALFNLCDFYDRIMGYLGLGSYAFDEEQAEEKKEEGRSILVERFRQRNPQENQLEMIQLL